jgi:hypothetical protein
VVSQRPVVLGRVHPARRACRSTGLGRRWGRSTAGGSGSREPVRPLLKRKSPRVLRGQPRRPGPRRVPGLRRSGSIRHCPSAGPGGPGVRRLDLGRRRQ